MSRTDVSSPPRQLRVLVYSHDVTTREAVRLGVGRRPARDLRIEEWTECATAPAVIEQVESGGYDLLILDAEATPYGGMGLCRQLKDEIFECPPVLLLTARVQDGWLAAWSYADAVVPHPLDPIALAHGVAQAVRGQDAG